MLTLTVFSVAVSTVISVYSPFADWVVTVYDVPLMLSFAVFDLYPATLIITLSTPSGTTNVKHPAELLEPSLIAELPCVSHAFL